jgi:hypothetical protein
MRFSQSLERCKRWLSSVGEGSDDDTGDHSMAVLALLAARAVNIL